MYITEVSIKRPVVAWVMSLILIIFGIFVFLELPVRELQANQMHYDSLKLHKNGKCDFQILAVVS